MRSISFLVSVLALAGFALYAQSATAIRGLAFDGDGKPVAGARVILTGAAEKTVTAGADGSFEFADLQAGHYRVAAVEEKREITSETSVAFDLAAGETHEADVTLGASTRHYPKWKRILRRLDGISQ